MKLRFSQPWKEKRVIGNAVLYLGNSLKILPKLVKVNAVITDPPYGTQELGGGYGRHGADGYGRRQKVRIGSVIINNRVQSQKIIGDTDLSLITAAFPLCQGLIDIGWLMIFYSAKKTPEFVQATKAGMWFGGVVWDKLAPGLGYHIRYRHEDIAVFRVGEPERPKDALLSIVRGSAPSEEHPHEKPVKILLPLVAWASKQGDTVLDPFMGCGSVGEACLRLGRKFIGIEISSAYYEVACRRIQKEVDRPSLFKEFEKTLPKHSPNLFG